ncbi:MAG: hypothetical protein Q4D51_08210 [Eubacteriales bacterium]|nr:hypothetical protein [Eubacteriales bacterium]
MYLISIYFDENANKILNRHIAKIAERTGNTFMTDYRVPPHMTISSVEARSGELLIPYVKQLEAKLKKGTIRFMSVGAFFPYVLYATPVLNAYLQGLSKQIYDTVACVPETTVSRYYQPMQWLPHVTLGKTLEKEQMQIAFQIMQEGFQPFEATVVRLGLAKTNPHEDLYFCDLK